MYMCTEPHHVPYLDTYYTYLLHDDFGRIGPCLQACDKAPPSYVSSPRAVGCPTLDELLPIYVWPFLPLPDLTLPHLTLPYLTLLCLTLFNRPSYSSIAQTILHPFHNRGACYRSYCHHSHALCFGIGNGELETNSCIQHHRPNKKLL